MGSRSGCAIFETFSEALQQLAQWQGCWDMCHVLDDFLMVSKGWKMADNHLKTFLGLCKDQGIPLVEEKTEKGMYCLSGCDPGHCENGCHRTNSNSAYSLSGHIKTEPHHGKPV